MSSIVPVLYFLTNFTVVYTFIHNLTCKIEYKVIAATLVVRLSQGVVC